MLETPHLWLAKDVLRSNCNSGFSDYVFNDQVCNLIDEVILPCEEPDESKVLSD